MREPKHTFSASLPSDGHVRGECREIESLSRNIQTMFLIFCPELKFWKEPWKESKEVKE